MDIVYQRLTEKELSRIIAMRIDQLTEEYTSEGRTVPKDVDLETALMDFYKRNMAAGTYISWIAFDGDKIVGTSGMSFVEKPPYFTCPSGKLGLLSSMFTAPEYRRMGIHTWNTIRTASGVLIRRNILSKTEAPNWRSIM